MDDIFVINTITELNRLLNQDTTKHPLVAVIDFSKVDTYGQDYTRMSSGFYTIVLKNHCHGKFKYGRKYYDFEEGTLLCMAPNQVMTIEKNEEPQKEVAGWGLFFHPDLFRATTLARKMKDYTFFSYDVNEALHLSDAEKQTLNDCVAKIEEELSQNIDKHSQTLIVSNIELFLNYCSRYYDRQFITRANSNKGVLAKFEDALTEYFTSEDLKEKGLPTVKYLADLMSLSANYLSDLLKRETGKNAQEHIHYHLIEEAKNRLLISTESVSEIAYELGFDYPQYFSKIFKKKTGMSPAEYRNLN